MYLVIFDPTTIPGIETEDGDGLTRISDFIENFSYNADINSTLDGFSIGALHWTDEIDSYDPEEGLTAILAGYEAAVMSTPTREENSPNPGTWSESTESIQWNDNDRLRYS